MRSLKKNQQRLQYFTYLDQITIYERDEDSNIIYADIADESEAKEYGVNQTDYEAVIVTTDKSLPIDELSTKCLQLS